MRDTSRLERSASPYLLTADRRSLSAHISRLLAAQLGWLMPVTLKV
ncbi:MAG: hypothetical protein ACAF41_16375 [Leptolyngbya sp. BL-A-14]